MIRDWNMSSRHDFCALVLLLPCILTTLQVLYNIHVCHTHEMQYIYVYIYIYNRYQICAQSSTITHVKICVRTKEHVQIGMYLCKNLYVCYTNLCVFAHKVHQHMHKYVTHTFLCTIAHILV
jgi:hypothetical protein